MDALTPYLDTLRQWLTPLLEPAAWIQLIVLVLAGIVAWRLHHRLSQWLSTSRTGVLRLTQHSLQRVVFPLGMLLVLLVGRAILHALQVNVAVLDIAVPLLLSLAGIRVLVYILRKGFGTSPALKAWENIISTSIWLLVALHLMGWLPAVLQALDELGVTLGKTRISLLSTVQLVLLVGLFFTLALWLSGVIERRVTTSPNLSPGMQVGLAKFSKFFLLTLSTLLALNAVGIDLTALTVFGGALGVGIGFGLQRIASNFISGFILIFDRSIRPGDVITIGQQFGWVQELHARYIVVRNREGVETLIPNENLITSEVINWSYSDRNVRVRLPVQVSYSDDPEQAMALMLEAAQASARVLTNPEPVVRLMEFADSGIALELRVWISDPENGIGNVRSEVNLAIWKKFKQAGITIPFPQRDVHIIRQDDAESFGNG